MRARVPPSTIVCYKQTKVVAIIFGTAYPASQEDQNTE